MKQAMQKHDAWTLITHLLSKPHHSFELSLVNMGLFIHDPILT